MPKYNSTLRHPLHQLVVYIFGFHYYIPCTYTTNVFNSHQKQRMGLKWTSQVITEIWKLIYGKWIHRIKLKHSGEALGDHTKTLIFDSKTIEENERGQDTLTYCYNPYFGTSLSTILDTSVMARNNSYLLIKTTREMTSTYNYTIFSAYKPLQIWLGIKSAPSLPSPPNNTKKLTTLHAMVKSPFKRK